MDAIIVTAEARDLLYARGIQIEQVEQFRNGMVRLVVAPHFHRAITLQVASGETLSHAVERLYR